MKWVRPLNRNTAYTLLVFATVLFLGSAHSIALADGTFNCTFDDSNGCQVSEETCGEGFAQACEGDTQEECLVNSGQSCVPEGGSTGFTTIPIADKVVSLYQLALSIGGIVAFMVIVFGGFLYTTSGGNESRISDAKSWITAAFSGLALLYLSFLILNLINPELTSPREITTGINRTEDPEDPDTAFGDGFFEGYPFLGGTDCDGFYNFGGSNAPQGNFGDPLCEFAKDSIKYKDDLHKRLTREVTAAGLPASIGEVFFWDVARCESRYNPNAVNLSSSVPQSTGAWGLFQMGLEGSPESSPPYDAGSVVWRDFASYEIGSTLSGGTQNNNQVYNAVNHFKKVGPGYWECWPGNVGGTGGGSSVPALPSGSIPGAPPPPSYAPPPGPPPCFPTVRSPC